MNKLITSPAFDKLSDTEKKYTRLMASQNGVPYIKGRPGEAKSGIARTIAKKLGINMVDLRLAEMDETEIGNYPQVEVDEETSVKYLDYIVPKWAIEANKQPTLLIFEEINRAPLPILNAALKILFEREVGSNYKLNDNVFMIATGNLGEDDGTFVNELDSALNNRLIHVNHKMTVDEWIENFANEGVIPDIVSFIKANPASYYSTKASTAEHEAYATPRTWTMLSDNIKANFGENPQLKDYYNYVADIGYSFVGVENTNFINFATDILKLSMDKILKSFDKYKDIVLEMDRSRKTSLIEQLKEMDVVKFTPKKLNNAIKFLECIHEDERVSYLKYVYETVDLKYVDPGSPDKSDNFEKLSTHFERETLIVIEGKVVTGEDDSDNEDS